MKLMEAVECAEVLRELSGNEAGWSSFELVDDFWSVNREFIEETYDTKEKIDALRVDGHFPELSGEALQNFPRGEISDALRYSLSAALEVAALEPEVLVEDHDINSLEALSMLTAFWLAYGEEISEAAQSYDPEV